MSENAMTDREASDVFDRWVRTFQVYQLAAGERGMVTITYTSDDAGAMARSLRVCANTSKCARRVLAARQEVEAERRGLEVTRAVWRAKADEGFRRGCFYTIAAGVAVRVLLDAPAVVAWWLS